MYTCILKLCVHKKAMRADIPMILPYKYATAKHGTDFNDYYHYPIAVKI